MRIEESPETTLSSRSFVAYINRAKEDSYTINLIYYWLDSVELAIARVKNRVAEGGHHIPTDIIIRRYHAGLKNFINLYKEKVDYWMVVDNSKTEPELIAEGIAGVPFQVQNLEKWTIMNKLIENETN